MIMFMCDSDSHRFSGRFFLNYRATQYHGPPGDDLRSSQVVSSFITSNLKAPVILAI